MTLWILKYLFHILFDGEKTSKELSSEFGDSIFSVSQAMSALLRLRLVKHPGKRPRYWEVDPANPIIPKLEELTLMSKNSQKIKGLLTSSSFLRIAKAFYRGKPGVSIASLMHDARLSKVTVSKILGSLVTLKLITKAVSKPDKYYPVDKKIAGLLFECGIELARLFSFNEVGKAVFADVVSNMIHDNTVLILIHYGSTARGKSDRLSDIDLFAVVRDHISRGEIISRYADNNFDLSVYSKSGFLQLLKKQPDFINNIAGATVLKGKDIIDAVLEK